jgi:hypothetical protein
LNTRDNSWIFAAPVADQMNVIRPDHKHSGIEIENGGVTKFLVDFAGHGERVMITLIETVHRKHTPFTLDV